MKSLTKEYLEYQQVGSTFKQKGSPSQREMLYATGFVCLNRKEYLKMDSFAHFLRNRFLPDILTWYCPDWFSDVVNDLTKNDWIPWQLDYKRLMELTHSGYVVPKDELVARLIPQMIFERDSKHQDHYHPENLERLPITLDQHIWLIFQFETSIHFSDRSHHFG
jgi:hypothetical protein